MTPEQFCYWLQGFAELRVGTAGPTDAQWKAIAEHLQTVFHKVTPITIHGLIDPSHQLAPGTVVPTKFIC